MDVKQTNLLQLCDTVMSIWTMDQLWGMFPEPCWIYTTKNYDSDEGKAGLTQQQSLTKERNSTSVCDALTEKSLQLPPLVLCFGTLVHGYIVQHWYFVFLI